MKSSEGNRSVCGNFTSISVLAASMYGIFALSASLAGSFPTASSISLCNFS